MADTIMMPVLLVRSELDYRSPEQESEIAVKLIRKGLGYYHADKKHWSSDDYTAFLNGIPSFLHNRIIINSNENHRNEKSVGLFYEKRYGAAVVPAWELLTAFTSKKQYLKVTSVDKLRHLNSALYFFDAVYFTAVNRNDRFVISGTNDYHRLRILISGTRKMIFASGCVNLGDIHSAVHFGFTGIVLDKSIWSAKSPEHEFAMIYNYVRRIKQVAISDPVCVNNK